MLRCVGASQLTVGVDPNAPNLFARQVSIASSNPHAFTQIVFPPSSFLFANRTSPCCPTHGFAVLRPLRFTSSTARPVLSTAHRPLRPPFVHCSLLSTVHRPLGVSRRRLCRTERSWGLPAARDLSAPVSCGGYREQARLQIVPQLRKRGQMSNRTAGRHDQGLLRCLGHHVTNRGSRLRLTVTNDSGSRLFTTQAHGDSRLRCRYSCFGVLAHDLDALTHESDFSAHDSDTTAH